MTAGLPVRTVCHHVTPPATLSHMRRLFSPNCRHILLPSGVTDGSMFMLAEMPGGHGQPLRCATVAPCCGTHNRYQAALHQTLRTCPAPVLISFCFLRTPHTLQRWSAWRCVAAATSAQQASTCCCSAPG